MPNFISEHLKQEVTNDINVLLRDLLKVIKVLTIYPPDNPLPIKMRSSVGKRFLELVSRYEGLVFEFRPNELAYQGEIVFRDKGKEEVLAGLFYNAGIVKLEFQPGIMENQFNSFLDIIRNYINDRSIDRDLVSQLWQEQIEFIKFTTVEDLALSEHNADTIIEELHDSYRRRPSDETDVLYSNVLSDENGNESSSEEITPGGEGQSGSPDGNVTDGDGSEHSSSETPAAIDSSSCEEVTLPSSPVSSDSFNIIMKDNYTLAEDEIQEIRLLLEENRYFDPYRTASRVLVEIIHIWDDQKPFFETIGICEKLLDDLLINGAFAVAADFVHTLRGLQEEMTAPKPAFAARLADFIRQAGDHNHIEQLTDIINRQSSIDPSLIEIYLESLGWESLVHINGMLSGLTSKESRIMVCNYLIRHGRDKTDIIGSGLRDKRWYVARNTAMILGKIGGERALHHLASSINHPHRQVREEVMAAIADMKSDETTDLLCRFLDDPDIELRQAALAHLENLGGRKFFDKLRSIISAPAFESYPINEQEQLLIALSRLGGAEVVNFLSSIAGTIRLFGSAPVIQYRLAALAALAYNRSPEAEKALLRLASSRRRWLRQAAAAALEQYRQSMYGGEANATE